MNEESRTLTWLAAKKFSRFDILCVIVVALFICFHLYLFAIGTAVVGWLTSFTIDYLVHGENE